MSSSNSQRVDFQGEIESMMYVSSSVYFLLLYARVPLTKFLQVWWLEFLFV